MSPFNLNTLNFVSLGRQEYRTVLQKQLDMRAERQEEKIGDTILTVEHQRVITQGRRPANQDFRVPPEDLLRLGFAIEKVNRGGKLTYHGPGQLVAYFIISLKNRGWTVPKFVSQVEETVIQTLRILGLEARRKEGCPGVWVEDRKIASLGLAVDRGVSMHGLALNIDPDLEDFLVITPCGMDPGQITSLKKETGRDWDFGEVERIFQSAAGDVFTSNQSW